MKVSRKQSVSRMSAKVRMLSDLPILEIFDAQAYAVGHARGAITHPEARFPNLRANSRLMDIMYGMRVLKKVDPYIFATAVAHIDHLLHMSKVRSKDESMMNLLKDKVLNTLNEYVFAMSSDDIEAMGFAARLRALDIVLYTEAIAPGIKHGRAFPMAQDGGDVYMFSGH